jgi:hypothetical protein
MDAAEQAEAHILTFFNKPGIKILDTFRGEEAWKHIVQIRYHGPRSRASVKRHYSKIPKDNCFLVIYTKSEGDLVTHICASNFINKYDELFNEEPDEGDLNMFDKYPIEYVKFPDIPKIITKLLKTNQLEYLLN